MRTATTALGTVHGLRVESGEDILLTLQAAVSRLNIDNAVILSGAGSATSYHYHVVSSDELPPENAFVRGKGMVDILNVSGMVLGGRVHAHISFCGQGSAFGGHLEEGCRVLTFCAIWLAEVPDVDIAAWDDPTGRDIGKSQG